jgi:hypothetical protein
MLNSSSPLGVALKPKVTESSHAPLVIILDSIKQITGIRAEYTYFPKVC